MKLRPSGIISFCLVIFAALTSCQRPAPAPENQPDPAPQMQRQEGEALKQRQQQIALDAREILQQYRDSMAMLRNPDSMQQIAEEDRAIAQQIRDSLATLNEPSKIDTVYILPRNYPGLPDHIASWLEKQGYVIPQAYTVQPEYIRNVIEGEFIVEGQTDIAVLTTNFIDSHIIIFPQKSTANAHLISLFEDSKDWNVFADSVATYRYTISHIPQNDLSEIYDSQPSNDFPKPEQDGIELYLVDRASSIYYLHHNEWIAIPFLD
jgi:hypothetical protein